MAIKVYISGVCGSQEVRKRQQRVLFVLTSMKIDYEAIDITEPGRDEEKELMKEECKKHNKENDLPPQIFNDDEYCGDYMDFEIANDDDKLLIFLKLQDESTVNEVSINGNKDEIIENEEKNINETVDISYNETNGIGETELTEETREENNEPNEEEKIEETKSDDEKENEDESEDE